MQSTVLLHGKIYLRKGVFAQALLVTGDRIAAVGTDEEILSIAPQGALHYDCAGRTVVPGFNDSHMHLQNLGQMLWDVQLLNSRSIAEVQSRTRGWIAAHRPAPGTVIHGMGWNQDYFEDEKRLLTAADLDAVSTEHPIILERACGHILVCNTKALETAGYTPQTRPVDGGAIDVENGKLTGILRENECNKALALIPPPTVETLSGQLRAAMRRAVAHGITSVQTMDLRPRSWRTMLAAYEKVQSENPILRVYHQHNFMEPVSYQEYLSEGHRTGQGTLWNRMGPLKFFVDGSLGARTALMRRPYHDDPSTSGIAALTPEEIGRLVSLAAAHGEQVTAHAIGDGAVERMLDAYEKARPDGTNPLRNAVIHVQITDRALLERFRTTGTLAQVQPIFLHYDTKIVEDRVGPETAATSYAFETLRRLGVHQSLGTDCPIEDLNPFHNLYCAVTRRRLDGEPAGGFHPEECLSVEDAVDAYTVESAYAEFLEHEKGRLAPGYLADLAVLSDDIFTCAPETLRDCTAVATMAGGRFVHLRA